MMRLSYRGMPYDYEPLSIDMAETELTGNYRGTTINFAYPRHIPTTQLPCDLQYRGISYHTSKTGQTTTRLIYPQITQSIRASSPSSAHPVFPFRMHKQETLRDVNRVHKTNLEERLRHRLDVARMSNNYELIAQLEKEMHQLI